MNYTEQMARLVGESRTQLRKRLNQARWCLNAELRKGFGKGSFHFGEKTLTGLNGVRLRWQIRRFPNLPESYENQQTTQGIVLVEKI